MAERQTQDSQGNNNINNNKRLAGTPGVDGGAHGQLKFNTAATDSDTIHRHNANNTSWGVHSRDSFSVASWSTPCAKLPPFRLRKGFVVMAVGTAFWCCASFSKWSADTTES